MAVIELEGVWKYYGDLVAVRDVSFKIDKGRTFTIIGPNGAGKTTILKLIVGILRPTKGSVRVFDKDPRKDKTVLKRVFYIPDSPSRVQKDQTIENIVVSFALLRGLPVRRSLSEARKIARELSIDKYFNKQFGSLSRGTQQKVFFMLVLLLNPDILIADEPTSMLDPMTREFILEKLRDFSSAGMTVFFSSHILFEVERVADYILLINNGRLIYEGFASELFARYSIGEYIIVVDDFQKLSRGLEKYGIEYEDSSNFFIIRHDDPSYLRRIIPKIVAELDLELIRFMPARSEFSEVMMREGNHK